MAIDARSVVRFINPGPPRKPNERLLDRSRSCLERAVFADPRESRASSPSVPSSGTRRKRYDLETGGIV